MHKNKEIIMVLHLIVFKIKIRSILFFWHDKCLNNRELKLKNGYNYNR